MYTFCTHSGWVNCATEKPAPPNIDEKHVRYINKCTTWNKRVEFCVPCALHSFTVPGIFFLPWHSIKTRLNINCKKFSVPFSLQQNKCAVRKKNHAEFGFRGFGFGSKIRLFTINEKNCTKKRMYRNYWNLFLDIRTWQLKKKLCRDHTNEYSQLNCPKQWPLLPKISWAFYFSAWNVGHFPSI